MRTAAHRPTMIASEYYQFSYSSQVPLRLMASFQLSPGVSSWVRLSLLKCKEKVQKKVFLKDDHLAQKPAQTDRFLQESHFIDLHKSPSFVQKVT